MNEREGNEIYEERVVAFLDILGFAELVQTGREQDILGIMDDLETRFGTLERMNNPVDLTIFSDSILATSVPLDDDFGIARLLGYVSHIAVGFFWRGILVRGGITIGQVYHKHPIAFGPAIISAYKLENQIAVYPRVVVTEEVMSRYVAHLAKSRGDHFDPRYFLRRDVDGIIHLEIFGPFCMQWPDNDPPKGTLSAVLYRPAREIMKELYKDVKEVRIKQKLDWFTSYLDASERDFGSMKINEGRQ